MPGERAIDKMLEETYAGAIRRLISDGKEPVEAMTIVWGTTGLRDRIKRSRMTLLEKLMAMGALDNWEARQAAMTTTAQQGDTPYRSMPLRSVPQPAGKGRLKRFLARAWAFWQGLPRGDVPSALLMVVGWGSVIPFAGWNAPWFFVVLAGVAAVIGTLLCLIGPRP